MDDVWKGLTALIAFSAFLVALAQWRMAREKLRLDLFEKRYKVFEATKLYLTSIFNTGRVNPQFLHEFRSATRDSVFLFRSDLAKYLEELNEKTARLQYLRERTDTGPGYVNVGFDEDDPPPPPPNDVERAQLEEEIQGVHVWAGDQLTEGKLQKAFEPYLRFRDQWSWVTAVLVVFSIAAGVAVFYMWFRSSPTPAAAPAPTPTCIPECQQAAPAPPAPAPPAQTQAPAQTAAPPKSE